MSYVDGYVVAVPAANKEKYRALAEKAATVFKEHGATRVVEAWGDEVPDGKVTDFRRAVNATTDEVVIFSWVEWPSKDARDVGMKKSMEDPRMGPHPDDVFDAKRMIFGGFAPILDV
jgi:uncharacterized protein YbaA (DUF1428 family)